MHTLALMMTIALRFIPTLLEEVDEGYIVRIVRDKDGYEEVITDFISKMLFDSCVRTGYITKVEDAKLSAITA